MGNSNSQKANHTRWCLKNPRRDFWEKNLGIVSKYGNIAEFNVSCFVCDKSFIVKEREKSFPKKDRYYCSRQCANSIGGKAKSQIYSPDHLATYITVCWRYHKKECVICGENLIVAVHHLNENHEDNRPENLIPLCPTHHQYWHSKHKNLVEPKINEYILNKWGG